MTLIKFGDLDATTLLIDVNIRQDADDPDGRRAMSPRICAND
jgi:hypothetical protein